MSYLMKSSHIIVHVILGIVIIGVIVVGHDLIYKPLTEDYDFFTTTRVSNQYSEPIYLEFYWNTEDELQVGNDVDISVIVTGLPYASDNLPPKEISLEFDEKFLNFWDEYSKNPLSQNKLILQYNLERNYFYSDHIKLRFIVPTDISATFCDGNVPKCFEIKNIIHPAPHDLEIQIQTNKIGLGVSLLLVVLSTAIIWSRITLNNQEKNKN